jgi:hypothetical protein
MENINTSTYGLNQLNQDILFSLNHIGAVNLEPSKVDYFESKDEGGHKSLEEDLN